MLLRRYLIAHSSADAALTSVADLTSSGVVWSGSDAVELVCGDTFIDTIGTGDEDPGSGGWTACGTPSATTNGTLVRKSWVVSGNMDWIASAGTNEDDCEWSLLSVDSFFAPTPMPTTPSPTPDQGLYISLYACGSENNKWLQITNGGTVEVDIDRCKVWVVRNGGSWNGDDESSFSIESGVLAPGESYLIAHVDADLAITEAADITSSDYTWNGDDAVGLAYDNVLVDSIGEDGDDPGKGWDMCGIPEATVDHTLVRKPGIVSGNTGWAVSAGTNAEDCEWIVLDSDVAFAPTLAPSDAPTTTFAPTRTVSPTPVPSLSLAPTALQVTVDSYLSSGGTSRLMGWWSTSWTISCFLRRGS